MDEFQFYKSLFFKLFNSKGSNDQNSIWFKFRKENLKIDVGLRFTNLFSEDKMQFITKYYQRTNDSAEIISLLEKNERFDDSDWQNIFMFVRNQTIRNMNNRNEKIKIYCSGTSNQMTLSEIQKQIILDYGDVFNTPTVIPDIYMLDQSKDELIMFLKKEFETKSEGKSKSEQKHIIENLQKIQSQEGEFFIVESLCRWAKEDNIPMVIFWGINSWEYIGRHMKGVSFSKPNELLFEHKTASTESEFDIMFCMLNGNKNIVANIQCKTSMYQVPWEESSQDQKVDKSNLSDAKNQLMKDNVRFSEIMSDVEFPEDLKFFNYSAFPLVEHDEGISKNF